MAAAKKGDCIGMPQEQHRATARVLDILEQLSVKREGLTLTELSHTLNAPKSSLFPIVHTLEERHYLHQNEGTGRYSIGSSCWVLGAAFAADGGLEPIVEVMKKIVEQCQETCQMGRLDGGDVLYMEKEDSPQAIRMISQVGNRLHANATAIGKALLSGLTDEELRILYAGGLPRLTENTVTDMDTLLAQLAEVRAGGIATEREESTPQLACWAVPLRRRDKVFAALSVSVPLFRCSPEKVDLVCRCLREAQAEIERLEGIWAFKL